MNHHVKSEYASVQHTDTHTHRHKHTLMHTSVESSYSIEWRKIRRLETN